MKISDEQIVKQTLSGHRDKYDRLVRKYQAAVYGITYQWTQNFADAQDLTQEVFVQAYWKLDQLKEPAKFSGWLRGIATNICRMWKRRQKNMDLLDTEDLIDAGSSSAPQPYDDLELREQQTAVVDVLDLLSDKIGLTARLFYVDGLSYKEISSVLSIPITTVESRLHHARDHLKKEVFGVQTDDHRKTLIRRFYIAASGGFQMDAVRLEIGETLAQFFSNNVEENMRAPIQQIRMELASEFDVVLPPVHITDGNKYLTSQGYMLYIEEERIAEGNLEAQNDVSILPELCTIMKDSLVKHREKFSK